MIDPEYDYPEPEPTDVPYWQLRSLSTGHEDYAFTEPELFELVGVYSALGTFSVEQHTRLTD